MPSYRDPESVSDDKYKMITHLFYAFLAPSTSADGSLQSLEQPGRLIKAANDQLGRAY